MTGQLEVTVDTQGRSGPMMKTASIYTNDRINPVRTVSVTLTVQVP